MSFSNVVGGKLKLKGSALDVKAGGLKKKKKRQREAQEQFLMLKAQEEAAQEVDTVDTRSSEADPVFTKNEDGEGGERYLAAQDHRTPAEKRYHEQKEKLEARRLTKVATKSHRQRVEEFNQYLANLSEHYDIPKAGLLVPDLESLDEDGPQQRVWDLSRLFLDTLQDTLGVQRVKAVFPKAGVAAFVKYQWKDVPYTFGSLNDRRPVFNEDEVVVLLTLDYQGLPDVERMNDFTKKKPEIFVDIIFNHDACM